MLEKYYIFTLWMQNCKSLVFKNFRAEHRLKSDPNYKQKTQINQSI